MEYKYEGHSLKSGIYKITNKINGRIYIGSAKEFKRRWSQHAASLKANKHSNKFLQSDYNKCGTEAFIFEVIEVIDGDKQQRLLVEERYIKQHFDNGNNCYNLCDRAISREGHGAKDPEETKKLISQRSKEAWDDPDKREKRLVKMRSEEFRNKQSKKQKEVSANPEYRNSAAANRKRHENPEEREKHSQSLKEAWAKDDGSRKAMASKLGKQVYEANKTSLREACRKASAKEYGYVRSPDGAIIKVINAAKFCRDNNLSYNGTIYNLLSGRIRTYKGWTLYVPAE
jgi:group I intron endonuclease